MNIIFEKRAYRIVQFLVGVLCLFFIKVDIVSSAGLRVLFLGNSYTINSKKMLETLRSSSPHGGAYFEYVAIGGHSLEQHLGDGSTVNRIRTGNWDYVVLQDHSLQPTFNSNGFRAGVGGLTRIIREACAEPILFMTWGRDHSGFNGYLDMQNRTGSRYESLANEFNLAVADVGWAWRGVYYNSRSTWEDLYPSDRHHPSKRGALLVASTFFRILYNSSLNWVPYGNAGASPSQWSLIKSQVLAQHMPLSNRQNCVEPEPDAVNLAPIHLLLLDD